MDSSPKKVVFVSGIFNILHPGHFRFLTYALNLGTELVVGVLSDKMAPEATVNENERLQNISDLSFVGQAALLVFNCENRMTAFHGIFNTYQSLICNNNIE